jgi:hypothetical protein
MPSASRLPLSPCTARLPAKNDFDRMFGFVIRAESEDKARSLAASNCGDEGPDAWLSEGNSTCVELRADGPAGVILESYNMTGATPSRTKGRRPVADNLFWFRCGGAHHGLSNRHVSTLVKISKGSISTGLPWRSTIDRLLCTARCVSSCHKGMNGIFSLKAW